MDKEQSLDVYDFIISLIQASSILNQNQSGLSFDKTVRGARFYDYDFPEFIRTMKEFTQELKRANDLKEQEIERKQFAKQIKILKNGQLAFTFDEPSSND